jgi:hypothetical protein
MGGAAGGFIPRTDDQKAVVPAFVDAAIAVGSGCLAAGAVAPFLMCVDVGVAGPVTRL